jgi:lipopolysaccharide/colanic/teichoic acid biosynthesis glycosyltransferase
MKHQYTTDPPGRGYAAERSFGEGDIRVSEIDAGLAGLDTVRARPLVVRERLFYEAVKRLFDISISFAAVLAALPLFLIVAIAVKLTSPGPVFFYHRRLGKNGEEFDCPKFRTMVSDAEELLTSDPGLRKQFSENYKINDDPRVTPIGDFLRRTSLDELPQLFLVMTGRMSLVGPRPIIKPELAKYSIYGEKLLTVKPGISGLWQVSGRSNTTYAERVLLDMKYIDNRSSLLDIKIVLMTFGAVIRKTGAC